MIIFWKSVSDTLVPLFKPKSRYYMVTFPNFTSCPGTLVTTNKDGLNSYFGSLNWVLQFWRDNNIKTLTAYRPYGSTSYTIGKNWYSLNLLLNIWWMQYDAKGSSILNFPPALSQGKLTELHSILDPPCFKSYLLSKVFCYLQYKTSTWYHLVLSNYVALLHRHIDRPSTTQVYKQKYVFCIT